MNNAEPWCPAALTTGGEQGEERERDRGGGGIVWEESKYRKEKRGIGGGGQEGWCWGGSDQVKKLKQWKCRAEKERFGERE